MGPGITHNDARRVLGLVGGRDPQSQFRVLARDVRNFKEGERVHGVPFDVEYMADKLFLAFSLARDVLLGTASRRDVPVRFCQTQSAEFTTALLTFADEKLQVL